MEAGVKSEQALSMIKQFCENRTELVKIIASEYNGDIEIDKLNSFSRSTMLLGFKTFQHERENNARSVFIRLYRLERG